MPGDSNQLFRTLKTALVALLVFIALVLFGLRYLAHENARYRDASTPPPTPITVPAGDSATTLFESLRPDSLLTASKSSSQFAPGLKAEADAPIPDTAQTESPAIIKQRGQKAQFNSRFIKVAFNGDELPPETAQWSCARDLETGLLWEVKLFNAGVSDAEHTYSWYVPDREYAGRANGGSCFGTACDTHAYTGEMNRLELCGSTQWRLPSFTELDGLIDRNYYNPTINQEIFPHARGSVYWTDTELGNNPEMVMQIDFFNGMSTAVRKNLSYALRLVSP